MTDKHIHKYAKTIQKYFRINKEDRVRNVISEMRYCVDAEFYDRNASNKIKRSPPFLRIVDLVNKSKLVRGVPVRPVDKKVNYAIRQMKSRYLANYSNDIIGLANSRVPNIASLSDELFYIEKNFGSLNLNLYSGDESRLTPRYDTLSAVTKDVYIQDFNFNKFKIVIGCKYLGLAGGGLRVLAIPLNPIYANGSNHPHPHVEMERLCVGEGTRAAIFSLAHGRLGDFFQIINSILNTYGINAGPYRKIEAWIGGECCDCGYDVGDRDSYTCGECENISCDGCNRYCEGCDRHICSFCSNSCRCGDSICGACVGGCNGCGHATCGSCNVSCDSCGSEYCSECMIYCSCGQYFCNSCSSRCSLCGNSKCEDCTSPCSSCGDIVCHDCALMCNSCEDYFCNKCLNSCEECESGYICKSCGKECSACGKEMCSECADTCSECDSNK